MVKQKKDYKFPTKLNLKCDDERWNRVLKFKIDNNLENANETVLELIDRGLKS
jgi:hypothetical protein